MATLIPVPDAEGELHQVLGRLEELLLALVDETDSRLPAPVRTSAAADAVGRLVMAVSAADRATPAQPVAPNGRFELMPLRWASIDVADLEVAGAALATLGRSLLPGGDELVSEAMRAWADDARTDVETWLARVTQAHGVLDLAIDEDVALLAEKLPADGRRIVLMPAEFEAYERFTERLMAMWHAGDPMARWLYRG